jgi:hypothetical protein
MEPILLEHRLSGERNTDRYDRNGMVSMTATPEFDCIDMRLIFCVRRQISEETGNRIRSSEAGVRIPAGKEAGTCPATFAVDILAVSGEGVVGCNGLIQDGLISEQLMEEQLARGLHENGKMRRKDILSCGAAVVDYIEIETESVSER